jgi:hypothetical protein
MSMPQKERAKEVDTLCRIHVYIEPFDTSILEFAVHVCS